MPLATGSGCINHPGVEAAARCKQCGKPVCKACLVSGPTGLFCSGPCKEKHEAFIQRAQQLEQRRKPGRGLFALKVKKFISMVAAVIILLLAIGFVSTYFGINIPYVTPFFDWARAITHAIIRI